MSIYNYSVNLVAERLMPPLLRGLKHLAWIKTIVGPLKWNSERIYNYVKGDNSLDYSGATNYVLRDRVRYTDNGIYELKVSASVGVAPVGHASSTTNWEKIQDNYIGIDERITYTGQYIVLQKALNRIFRIDAAPYIFIQHSAPTFVVFVPIAVWTALGPTATDRDNTVKLACSRYQVPGTTAGITTY